MALPTIGLSPHVSIDEYRYVPITEQYRHLAGQYQIEIVLLGAGNYLAISLSDAVTASLSDIKSTTSAPGVRCTNRLYLSRIQPHRATARTTTSRHNPRHTYLIPISS